MKKIITFRFLVQQEGPHKGCRGVTFQKENAIGELPVGTFYLTGIFVKGKPIPIGSVERYTYDEKRDQLTMELKDDGGLEGSSIVDRDDFPKVKESLLEAGWVMM